VSVITAADIAELRALYAATALLDTCVVTAPARPGETAAVQTLPCAVTPFSGFQSDQGGGGDTLIRQGDVTLCFAFDAAIARASIVTVQRSGKTYEVGDVSTPGTFDCAVLATAIWKRP
jgi:hypothetical protein